MSPGRVLPARRLLSHFKANIRNKICKLQTSLKVCGSLLWYVYSSKTETLQHSSTINKKYEKRKKKKLDKRNVQEVPNQTFVNMPLGLIKCNINFIWHSLLSLGASARQVSGILAKPVLTIRKLAVKPNLKSAIIKASCVALLSCPTVCSPRPCNDSYGMLQRVRNCRRYYYYYYYYYYCCCCCFCTLWTNEWMNEWMDEWRLWHALYLSVWSLVWGVIQSYKQLAVEDTMLSREQ